MRVLDIRYRHRGVADSVIDYGVDRYRHRVFGQNLRVQNISNCHNDPTTAVYELQQQVSSHHSATVVRH